MKFFAGFLLVLFISIPLLNCAEHGVDTKKEVQKAQVVQKEQVVENSHEAQERMKTAGLGAIIGGIAGYSIHQKAKLSASQNLQPYQATAIGAAVGGATGYVGHSVPVVKSAMYAFENFFHFLQVERQNFECLDFYGKNTKGCKPWGSQTVGLVDMYTHSFHHVMGLAELALASPTDAHQLLSGPKFIHMMRSHAKANTGWSCAEKDTQCQKMGTSTASVQTDKDCVYKVATDENYLGGAALGRWVELVWAFEGVPEKIFVEQSRLIGAAIVVCAAIDTTQPNAKYSVNGANALNRDILETYKESTNYLKKEILKAKHVWSKHSSGKSKLTLKTLMDPVFDCSKSGAHFLKKI